MTAHPLAATGRVAGLLACLLMLAGGCRSLWLSNDAPPAADGLAVIENPLSLDDGLTDLLEQRSPVRHAADWSGASPAPPKENSPPVEPLPLPAAAEATERPLAAADPPASGVMSINDVLALTLKHHPQLRARRHEIDAAEGRLLQARLWPNPNLVIDTESPLTENDPTTISSRLVFTIPLTRKGAWRQGVECAGIERARARLGEDAELLLAEAADAAIEVAYFQQLAKLQEQMAALAAQAVAANRERITAQFADTAAAETEAAGEELARLDTTERLQTARARLARAMGLSPNETIEIEGELTFMPLGNWSLDDVVAQAKTRHPRIASAEALVAQSRQAHGLARAEAWPDINLGPRFQADTDGPDDRLGARFAMNVPIFDRNQGKIAETAAQVRASCELLAAARLATLGDVAMAFNSLSNLQQAINYYAEKVTPSANRMRTTLAELERQRGVEAYQIIEVRRRLVKMQIEHLDRLHRYSRLLTRLELFLGQPLAKSSISHEPT